MRELALFTGAGGGILGGYLLGWETVCAVEFERYRIECLLQRQKDGILGRFPIWDDIRTFDGKPWRDRVDIVTGGFPCQDISLAGKGAGITGERSGLWREMARVVGEVRPRFVFVENSPALLVRGFGVVAGDLVEMGYDLRWCVLGADDAGAPHRRKRIWILAYLPSKQCREAGKFCEQSKERTSGSGEILSNSDTARLEKWESESENIKQKQQTIIGNSINWWDTDPADLPDADEFNDDDSGYGAGEIRKSKQAEIQHNIPNTGQINTRSSEKLRQTEKTPFQSTGQNRIRPTQSRLGRVAHGVAHRVDRLKAIGDGQVPAVAAIAFIILSEGLV